MSKEQNIKDIYSLAPLQYGLLYHWLLDRKSPAYFDQFEYTLKGDMEIDTWKKSLNILIDRYDILRTIFIHEGVKEPLQVVLKKRTLDIHFEDITHMGKKQEKEEYIIEYRRKDREKVPDLSRDMLLRIALFKTEAYEYRLIWSVHHIIMEAWCIGLLYKEVYLVYQALKEGNPPRLQPVPAYKNFIRWVEGQDKKEGLRYWREYLKGYHQPALVPKDVTGKQTKKKNERCKYHFVFPQWLSTGLLKIARKNNVTLNTVIQVIWGIVLQRYNNVDDVVYGTVVSGRPPGIEGVETMVGLFINTIPSRIKIGKHKYITQLMRQVQHQEGKSKAYEYLPLAEVQSCSGLKQNLIHHIMAFESLPVKLDKPIENSGSSHFDLVNMKSFTRFHYDFGFAVIPMDPLAIDFRFNLSAYSTGFIENAARHIKAVAKQIVEVPGIEIRNIRIISEEEKRQILETFNNTQREYPREKTLHQLFTRQVKQVPHRIAVIGAANSGQPRAKGALTGLITSAPAKQNIHLTYNHLNKKSNRLAYLLMEKGSKPDFIIGIMEERSLEMIVGVLAILKAGGIYFPIDPDYPFVRKKYMLDDSNANILLTSSPLMEKDGFHFKGEIVPLDDMGVYRDSGKDADGSIIPESFNKASKPAYIMYTSGSTGRPKGVVVEHRNVVRLVVNTNYVKLTKETRILQTGAPVFDATTFEVWGALLNSGQLVLVGKETILDAHRLGRVLERNKINTLWLTSSLFNQLTAENREIFSTLDYLLVGGDVLSPGFIKMARNKHKSLKIINGYGPTENTTFSTTFLIDKDFEKSIPIGSPIHNSTAFILDRYGGLQPVGIFGELCVGGDGVSPGYINSPELTREKFINAPFKKGERLYRTGDIVRWLPDGNIEFSGRIDQQVKIRGFRIELGEIENQLLKHQNIKEVVVIDRQDQSGEKHLNAYFVSDKQLTVTRLREALLRVLPPYMIPSYFLRVEKIPLTPNGKLDRESLPVIQGMRPHLGTAYTGARSTVEKKIAMHWKELLDVDEVGVNDNFFELGGNSNKIIQLRSRLKEVFPGDIPITIFFEYPTIRLMANFFKQEQEAVKKNRVSSPAPGDESSDRIPRINEGKVRLQQRMKQRR